MSFNLNRIVNCALVAAFRLGPAVVRDASFYRPPSFNAATGELTAAEVVATCKFVGGVVLSTNFIGIAPVALGTETLLIRASELASISGPRKGDYVVEASSGLRRDVEAARLDLTGQFYTFQTVRSANEDWGDVTAQTVSEDWGDLTAATAFDDRLALA
jgi:hypothetical protein